jgi:1,4-dihydroxy-2-naphthoyl-CoA synthase
MWFLARMYTAQQAMEMGLINTVGPACWPRAMMMWFQNPVLLKVWI